MRLILITSALLLSACATMPPVKQEYFSCTQYLAELRSAEALVDSGELSAMEKLALKEKLFVSPMRKACLND
jgi:hypothetical protein